jgi:hypothetical protein
LQGFAPAPYKPLKRLDRNFLFACGAVAEAYASANGGTGESFPCQGVGQSPTEKEKSYGYYKEITGRIWNNAESGGKYRKAAG